MKKLFVLIVLYVFISGFTIMAQTNVITGTVTSSVQKEGAILGVTVTVKGTTVGVLTDANGKYSLTLPPNATTLVFSYLGMKKQEIEIGGRNVIDVIMTADITSLNEVVVTALGIVRQEKALGYSTTQVKAKDLVQSKQINVVNGLTAKVSGLQITTVNNGLFAPTRITLRGNRSLTGNNEALIIVDGAIYYNDISNLNPDDIESINILKGASASANYGSDASNGVLVITTKKGVSGKPVINYSSSVQLETVAYMPALQNEFGSNGGESFPQNFDDLRYYIPDENQQFGPRYNGKLVPLGRPIGDGSLLMVPYSAIKNEKRKFWDNAITTQNNISYSAGDEKGSFFLSAQDVHSNGVMPKDFGTRDVFRAGGS